MALRTNQLWSKRLDSVLIIVTKTSSSVVAHQVQVSTTTLLNGAKITGRPFFFLGSIETSILFAVPSLFDDPVVSLD